MSAYVVQVVRFAVTSLLATGQFLTIPVCHVVRFAESNRFAHRLSTAFNRKPNRGGLTGAPPYVYNMTYEAKACSWER